MNNKMDTIKARKHSQNSVVLFILRFDLVQNNIIIFDKIREDISKYFDRTEIRLQTNYHVNFTTDKSEINKSENSDYVLINENENFSLTFSKSQNSFWFETPTYRNKETYNNIVLELIKSARTHEIKITIRRIGMRFINNFPCPNAKGISKIFSPFIRKTLIQTLSKEQISRIICQEEFIYDTCKVKVQYGIPNKFYPAPIKNYDLLLDIDSYDDQIQELDTIPNAIENLNHCAYSVFLSNINPAYLDNQK